MKVQAIGARVRGNAQRNRSRGKQSLFGKLISGAVGGAMVVTSAFPAAADTFYYRYSAPSSWASVAAPPNPGTGLGEGNDIAVVFTGEIGRFFSQPVSVKTKDVVSWKIVSGGLQSGLGLDASSGLVSGTPTGSVTDIVAELVGYDAAGTIVAKASITSSFRDATSEAPIELTPVGVLTKAGKYFASAAPTFSGTKTGVRFYTTDDLSGLDLTVDPSTGVISGLLGDAQARTVNVSITDDTGRTTTKPVLIEVLPAMVLSAAVSTTAKADEPIAPIMVDRTNVYGAAIWNPVPASDLPPGIVFDTVSGQFTGTPTAAGTWTILVTSTDGLNDTGSVYTTIVVRLADDAFALKGPTVQPLPTATKRESYSFDLRSLVSDDAPDEVRDGIVWNVAWEEVSGFPNVSTDIGLSGSTISGTPRSSGAANMTVTATYGGTTRKATYPLTGVLPAVSVTLADNESAIGPYDYNVAIPTFATQGLLTVQKLDKSSVAWSAAAPAVLSAGETAGLPTGLSLSPTTGEITGTPTVPGLYRFSLAASFDDLNPVAEHVRAAQDYVVRVRTEKPSFLYMGGGLDLTVAAYTGTITGNINVRTTGNTQYVGGGTFTQVSGTLPPGITFDTAPNASFMTFNGYATTPGVYDNLVFRLTDPSGNVVDSKPYRITVAERDALALAASSDVVSSLVGKPLSATVTASNIANGALDPTGWAVSGQLPPGVSAAVSGNVVTFSGTPTEIGTYNVTVDATDSAGGKATKTVSFAVTGPFSFASTTLPSGSKRLAYSADLRNLIDGTTLAAGVTKDQIAWTWALDPNRDTATTMAALPAGITLSGAGISGTPTNSGTYAIVLTASYDGFSKSKAYVLTIGLQSSSLALADATLPAASIANAYSYDMSPLLSATNVPASSVTWAAGAATAGTGQISGLPNGVVLSSAGKLSGVPTSAGSYVFTVTAAFDDANAQTEHVTASKVYSITSSGAAEFARIDIGDYHSCVLTKAGGVKCWGQGSNGQLGNGKTTNSSVPVDVTGLTSGVAAIAVGSYHTCALTTGGAVKCWGSNTQGQLGNGNTTGSSTPVQVSGLTSGYTSITAADGNGTNGHSCALSATGGIKCWGSNAAGQLGNSSTVNSSVPVDVTGLTSGAKTVAAGSLQTCAITNAGTVKCWGSNNSGQLGNGTNNSSSVPVDVAGLTNVVALKGGGDNTSKIATCAVTGSGGLKCWGSNSDGQLGNGSASNSNVPVDVTGLTSGVVSVALGNRHACASLSSGAVKCWGWNANGQLGNGKTASSNVPVDVTGLTSGATAAAAGYQHSCAITSTGSVKCWGQNTAGQLGDGSTTQSTTPVNVSGT